MNGMKVMLTDGRELHFENAGYWAVNNDHTLEMKTDKHGDTIAHLNWQNVFCVHSSDDMEVIPNTNI